MKIANYRKRRRQSLRGMTLMEVLIVLVVLGIIFGVVVFIFNIITKSWLAGYGKTELEQQARAALRQVEAELREATNFYGYYNTRWNIGMSGIGTDDWHENFSQVLFSADLNHDGKEEYIYYYLLDDTGNFCSTFPSITPGDENSYTLYRAEGPCYDYFLNPVFSPSFAPQEGKVVCRFVDRSTTRTQGTKFYYNRSSPHGGTVEVTLSLFKKSEKISLTDRIKPRQPANINVFGELWGDNMVWSVPPDPSLGVNNGTGYAAYQTFTVTEENFLNWNVFSSGGGNIFSFGTPSFPPVFPPGYIKGLTIKTGQVLEIRGGVTVLFDNDTELYIQPGGLLRIRATETDKVVFKALSRGPTANRWRGIRADDSSIEGAIIGENLMIQDT